jgi:hypothetical protein
MELSKKLNYKFNFRNPPEMSTRDITGFKGRQERMANKFIVIREPV